MCMRMYMRMRMQGTPCVSDGTGTGKTSIAKSEGY